MSLFGLTYSRFFSGATRVGSLTYNTLICKCHENIYSQSLRRNEFLKRQSMKYTTVSEPQSKKQEYEVTFVKANGDRIKAKGKEGDSLLDVVVNNNLDFDGYGACEGTLTCSTCHIVLKKEDYDRIPEKPSDEELDMLDLAYDLCDTLSSNDTSSNNLVEAARSFLNTELREALQSRLGCQIQLTKDLHGLEVRVPATVNDARS